MAENSRNNITSLPCNCDLQFEETLQRASARLYIIRVCKYYGFPIKQLDILFRTLIMPILTYEIEVEAALQEIHGEVLNSGSNKAQDARLDVLHARGFWERRRSAFFDIRVCHPNAESYKELTPKQICRIHENEKKRMYNQRVTDIE